jgi:hypothetical protein
VILVVIAAVVAYLEYDAYPTIMAGHPFYESDITLHLAPFTYAYNAIRCVRGTPTTVANCSELGGTIQTIHGIPALDFFQLFVVIIVLANIYHIWTWSKRR